MRHNTIPKLFCFVCCVVCTTILKAQLCTGSLGDPVINTTFGSGPNPGPPLAAATTSYQYVNNACPVNGFYTVLSSGIECNYGWHVLQHDHTGDANGYFMLVDASYAPSDFYLDTVRGLCANTTYEFAAWILNMKKIQQGIRPNITFKIEKTDGTPLASYNSGDVPPEDVATWRQYGLYFTTPVGSPDIVLRMTNNAQGGDGNDLALDDITFRPCGPLINPSITGSSNTTTNICVGDTASIMLGATVSGGYVSPQFQWQLSVDSGRIWQDIPGANAITYRRLATSFGEYQYRLAVAEAGNIGLSTCRVASTPLTVNVNPLPVPTAVNDGPNCAGSQFTLTAGGGTSYVWTGPGNFRDSAQVATVANAVNGSKYYVTVTNSYNCSAVDSTVLAVNANPVAKFSASLPACAGGAVNFTDQSTVAGGESITKRAWLFGDGASSSATNPNHVYGQANTYNVSLAIMTDKGCTDSITQPIVIHCLPQPVFTLPKVCLSDPFAVFTDASAIADSSESGFSYQWNFGDANATAVNPNTSTQQNPKHSYTATGVYNVQLTVTSNNGCLHDTIEPFTVNGAFPKAAFSLNNNGSICSNTSLVLTDNSTVNFGTITQIEVYWDYSNDTLNRLVDDSTKQGKRYTTQYPVFDNPASKSYSIKYIASSGINCVSEIDTVVTVKASPLLAFTTLSPVCEGVAPFNITQASETNGMAGTGVYTGRGVDPAGLFNPSQAGLGLDILRYTFTATDGCSAFVQQQQLVYAQPTADAGPDRRLLQGGSLVIAATASGNNPTYLWTPNTSINNNTLLTPSVSPVADITYTLTVTSSDGCVAQDSMNITVLKTPLIPNAFSPNGDGINDYWMINYLNSYANVTVQVFNRNGQQVFSSKGYSNPWDGTLNGKPLPVGTYYYIINRNIAGAGVLTGWVAIIK